MEETLREEYGGAIRKGKSRTEIFLRKFGFAAACRGARSGSLRRADMDDRRLTELELKFMEQEQALSELSDMVNRQWQEIEGLKGRLLRAQDRIISLEESLPAAAGPEKPPHY